MTSREEFHQFVDGLDEDLVKPALRAIVAALPDELLLLAVQRMRALRAGRAIFPPELSNSWLALTPLRASSERTRCRS